MKQCGFNLVCNFGGGKTFIHIPIMSYVKPSSILVPPLILYWHNPSTFWRVTAKELSNKAFFKWFNSSRKTDFKIVAHRVLLTFSCSGGNLGYQIFIKSANFQRNHSCSLHLIKFIVWETAFITSNFPIESYVRLCPVVIVILDFQLAHS